MSGIYRGDFPDGGLVEFFFRTEAGAEPASLVDGTVVVYKGGALPGITAGVTLTPDFGGIVGLNYVAVDTSQPGYGVGANYQAVLTAGTVDGIEITPVVLDSFSIENRTATSGSFAGTVTDFVGEAGEQLDAIKAKTDTIVTGDISIQSPFNPQTGKLTLTRGDDYPIGTPMALPPFTSSDWDDLTDAQEIRMTVRRRPPVSGLDDPVLFTLLDDPAQRITGSGAQSVSFAPMSAANAGGDQDGSTDDLVPGLHAAKADIQATLADGTVKTLVVALVDVVEDQTRVA